MELERLGLPLDGGPSARAGIRAADATTNRIGDVIVGIDNQHVETFDDLLGYIVEQTAVGETVELQVLRNGSVVSVSVVMGERPSSN